MKFSDKFMKTGHGKINAGFFIWIFVSNSRDNKPLTQYRVSSHMQQSFTSDEIIDLDIKGTRRPVTYSMLNFSVHNFQGSWRHSDTLEAIA